MDTTLNGVLVEPDSSALPLRILSPEGWEEWLGGQSSAVRAWLEGNRFRGRAGTGCLLPGERGEPAGAVAVLAEAGLLWDWAAVAEGLPCGAYRLEPEPAGPAADRAALAWLLSAFRDDRFRKSGDPVPPSQLVWPAACNRAQVTAAAEAIALVRRLINTPANLLGPAELAEAAAGLAAEFGAATRVVAGRELSADYPAIQAVGAGAPEGRAPRLIDIAWGRADHPGVTLVGKGVCFDTGGLDVKPASAMKLMKKDMGGAAAALGLARMIMAARLPVRLRVLIAAVENVVSGAAMRPLDIVRTRNGKTIEIANTDAEGRVILADALSEAASGNPELIIDFATLTGAARVALGPDVPALFSNDDAVADGILAASRAADDPVWRMPLWEPYRKAVEGRLADLNNSPEGGAVGSGYAGAITAALFLQAFVEPVRPWVHFDMMAWNLVSRPGRPEGGEAMAIRAVYGYLAARFAG